MTSPEGRAVGDGVAVWLAVGGGTAVEVSVGVLEEAGGDVGVEVSVGGDAGVSVGVPVSVATTLGVEVAMFPEPGRIETPPIAQWSLLPSEAPRATREPPASRLAPAPIVL